MLDIERDWTVVALSQGNQSDDYPQQTLPLRLKPLSGSEFTAIKQFAEQNLLAVVQQLLPGGKVIGKEYVVRNPMRADKRAGSFKICISGPKAGVWSDFATSAKGGDRLSLVSYVKSLSRGEAARWLQSKHHAADGFG